MIPISIKQLQVILDAESIGIRDSETMIDSISTDTREIKVDSVFFALTGHHFDGHDFATNAIESGAKLVVVSRQISDHLPQLIVKDVLKALGRLAHWVRKQVNPRIVALTGSSGKTSVKEMTAAILKQCGQTHYTQGNLNNEIGVPLTLLQLTPDDQFAVIELGANHPGEIAYTTALTEPESALINNIAAAHLEGFGSLAGVAKAKCEIFQGLPATGKAFLNMDSHIDICIDQLKNRHLNFFSLHSEKADYYARDIVESSMQTSFVLHTPDTQVAITLPVIGLHNVSNAIAASALALSVGATQEAIVKGLSNLQPVKGRLYPISLNESQFIFDDTYNANVGSMTAAIEVLAAQSGYRVLVVGDMGELGADAKLCHQRIGELAKQAHIDCVLSFGQLSELISQQNKAGKHFTDKAILVKELQRLIATHPQLTILVKGSRSMRMEQVIETLLDNQSNLMS